MNQEKMYDRMMRCVCKYCGSDLMMQEIIHNQYGGSSVELYCPNCRKMEYGTEQAIYLAAKDFIDNMEFQYYNDLEDNQQTYQMNIAKVCEILSYCFLRLDLLHESGLSDGIVFQESLEL